MNLHQDGSVCSCYIDETGRDLGDYMECGDDDEEEDETVEEDV